MSRCPWQMLAVCLWFCLGVAIAGPVSAEPSEPEPADAALGRELVLEALERSKGLVAEGKYDEAEALMRPVFHRAAELAGQDLVLAGAVVEVLAHALHSAGRDVEPTDRARLLELIALQEKALGPYHPALAKVLLELACLSHSWRDAPETEQLYQRIYELQEREGDRIAAARTRNYSAILLFEAGDLGRAKEAYEEALRVLEAELGSFEQILAAEGYTTERALVAEVLSSLAMLTVVTGDHGRSEALFQQAGRLYEQLFGPEHRALGRNLYNRSFLLSRLGRDEEAIRSLRRVVALWTELLGQDHFYLGLARASLGRVLTESGQTEEAELQLLTALDNLQASLGPNAYRTAVVHRRLGDLYRRSGRPTDALDHYQKAIAVHDQGPFREHPEVARNLAETARLLFEAGHDQEAFDLALQAESRARTALVTSVDVLAEKQAIYVSLDRSRGLDTVLTLTSEGGGNARRAWDGVIRSRALVLEEVLSRRQMSKESHPLIQEQIRELVEARRRLATLYVQVVDRLGNPRHLAEAMNRRDAAESALAESSRVFRRGLERRRTGLEEVLRKIPKGDALVAFVRYHHLSSSEPDRPGVPSYMAFVRPAGAVDTMGVAAVPLGPADLIDRRVETYLTWIARHSESRYQQAARRLRSAIWDPVAAELGEPARVVIVPDSELHRVQWNALVMEDGSYWVEHGPATHIVTTEREIVSIESAPVQGPNALLTVGGVDFDAPAGLGEDAAEVSSARFEANPTASTGACSALRDRRFAALDGSASEARRVAELARSFEGGGLRVTELSGSDAGEAAFRASAPESRYLHLATHGFLLGQECLPEVSGDTEPFLRSGLVMAGANRRHRAASAEDDGILTAEEIAALDLSRAQLVVLSACDTALGRAVPGEGVLGLRRAFRVAGAKRLLSSLWPVDDAVAEQWMTVFYRSLFDIGLDLPDASRRASREVLLDRRRKGLETHPYFWAPFISEGLM